ncbi:MAG: TetR family transcriptional regulator C-terminal domain-containing protein [Actinomycetota bacterium]|nr:TetR family transcriptional regulator C-terminal domain-containing protein [Actinomycetota bacterium]
MARPSDKVEARKREILESFYQVLIDEGLEGASMAKIADRMDIHPSLIVHYFSTKEEMIVELVDFILEIYRETFLPRVRKARDPEERLQAAADALFSPEWAKLVDTGVFFACYSLSFRNERVRESFKRMYSTLREFLVEELSLYMEEGVIAEAEPGKVADLLITLLEGYDYYRNLMEDDERFEELGGYIRDNALAIMKTGSARAEGRP